MEYTYNIVRPLIKINNLSFEVNDNGERKVLLRDIGTETKPFLVNDVSRPNIENTGQTVAIVGRSGGGKSTLFRLLAGLTKPTSGEILIPKHTKKHDDFDKLVPVEEGTIGFVQQNYPLSRNQSVYDMLWDATIQGGIPRSERNQLIEKYLQDWGLVDQKNQSKIQLSGGQQQRVAIMEQLLCSHHFIIFDEPFSGLDPKNVNGLKQVFKQITNADEINTILFSTHDLHLAVELADQIFVIGYEKENGVHIPGGTIIQQYDLKQMGMAWQEYGKKHQELKEEIKNIIETN